MKYWSLLPAEHLWHHLQVFPGFTKCSQSNQKLPGNGRGWITDLFPDPPQLLKETLPTLKEYKQERSLRCSAKYLSTPCTACCACTNPITPAQSLESPFTTSSTRSKNYINTTTLKDKRIPWLCITKPKPVKQGEQNLTKFYKTLKLQS